MWLLIVSMQESDWNLDMQQWSLMSRCNKCGLQIFPHNRQAAYQWAEQAYAKSINGASTPESLRDQRLPRKKLSTL